VNAWPAHCLCLVTDRRRCAPSARTPAAELRALNHQLDEATEAGIDLIHVREPDLSARQQRDFVADLVRRVGRAPCRVLLNDRIDVTIASGAHGVHLRGRSVPTIDARTLAAALIIGRSVRDEGDVRSAGQVDYLVAGTAFATRSKPGVAPLGAAGLSALVTAAAGVPVLAIGGITPDRMTTVQRAGAAGIAAIGLFLPAGTEPGALGVRTAIMTLRAAMRADIC